MNKYEKVEKAMLKGIEILVENIKNGNYPESFRNELLEIMIDQYGFIKRFRPWEKKVPVSRRAMVEPISEDRYEVVEEETRYAYQRNEYLENMFKDIMEDKYDSKKEMREIFEKWNDEDENFMKEDLYIYDYIEEEDVEKAKKELISVRKKYAGLVGKSVLKVRAESPSFPSPFEAVDYYKNEIALIEGGFK